jgi:hypothetical protein
LMHERQNDLLHQAAHERLTRFARDHARSSGRASWLPSRDRVWRFIGSFASRLPVPAHRTAS